MADVTLRGVRRAAGETVIIDDLTLDIRDGEFLTLLGPSGCGKTTLLRMLAGFEPVAAGEIRFAGALMSAPGHHVPPEDRRVGMVFQSYALWPHLDVGGNVGYALRVRGMRPGERAVRIAEALETVGLPGFERRRIDSLSGGQRQRVALARCLAMQPRLVLLDEPLANLDAHLREVMVDEFRRFHEASGATMVYVTHDQAEAMALADRVAVMDGGRLEQIAPPRELYRAPESEMVARFVGHGQLVPVEVMGAEDGLLRVWIFGRMARLRGRSDTPPGPALACLRTGDMALAEGSDGIAAEVVGQRYEGPSTLLRLAPRAAPDCMLSLNMAGPPPEIGAPLALSVRDGWVLPGSAQPQGASAPPAAAASGGAALRG